MLPPRKAGSKPVFAHGILSRLARVRSGSVDLDACGEHPVSLGNRPFGSRCGFTLLELLLVVAIIMILTTLMLPVVARTKGRSHQLECLNQLRHTGVGFISYAQDHGDKFPFQVSTKDGGTLELVNAANQRGDGDVFYAFRHFQALSNELVQVRIFRCPVDFRTAAPTFPELKNENISYFLAVTADPLRPESLLAGDRNISEKNGQPGSIVKLTAMSTPHWTRAGHEFKGNLLFSGGHAERSLNAGLQVALRSPTGPVSVWMPVAAPVQTASRGSAGGSSGGGNSDSDRGFTMLQNFFQAPSSSSGSSPAPQPGRAPVQEPAPGVASSPRAPVTKPSLPHDAAQPVTEMASTQGATNRLAAAPITPAMGVPASEPVTAIDDERSARSLLVVMIDPEQCWWCWWLILGVSVLVAFILGFLVHRRRRARRDRAAAWAPAWEVPQSPGRR